MEILGYFSIALIGITLGLLGAGGSILTLPVMVYFFRLGAHNAIRYSLFLVSISSIFAIVPKLKKKEVLIKEGLLFGAISVNVVWMTRAYLVPRIPKQIAIGGEVLVSSGTLTMMAFSLLMILASRPMIRGPKNVHHFVSGAVFSVWWLIICALGIGLLTGLLGAGGGFLIVPMLVIFFGLDTRRAIGTSLLIIAINALGGFLSDLATALDTDWLFLMKITVLGFISSLFGEVMSSRIDKEKLRCGFGWFILVLALIILSTQIYSWSAQGA